MNTATILFLLVNSIALLRLPRSWAVAPLLLGACYVTLGQYIEVGPFAFTFIRVLIAVGFARVLLRGETLWGGMLTVDKLMLVGSAWTLFSAAFHAESGAALVFRMGQVYNVCGIYFLIRVFCTSLPDVINIARFSAFLLVPVAIEMLYEHATVHNLFSMLGGVPENPAIRAGRLRAQGPFTHAILAGTVGAVTLPFMAAIWKTHRKTALVGVAACCTMILAASSSGPIMSAVAAIGALFLWHYRQHMQRLRWCALASYILLDLVMKVPAYYLFFRIRILGASTGWHRGYLIEQAFKHLPEWWFAGTDYTRHWMPAGVTWSPDHADITNYYLHFGVMSGLPRMLLFIACLWVAFRYVGETIRQDSRMSPSNAFIVWTLGASLGSHAVTGLSVSYFDQSFVFIYLTLGAIVSLRATAPVVNSINTVGTVETGSIPLSQTPPAMTRLGSLTT